VTKSGKNDPKILVDGIEKLFDEADQLFQDLDDAVGFKRIEILNKLHLNHDLAGFSLDRFQISEWGTKPARKWPSKAPSWIKESGSWVYYIKQGARKEGVLALKPVIDDYEIKPPLPRTITPAYKGSFVETLFYLDPEEAQWESILLEGVELAIAWASDTNQKLPLDSKSRQALLNVRRDFHGTGWANLDKETPRLVRNLDQALDSGQVPACNAIRRHLIGQQSDAHKIRLEGLLARSVEIDKYTAFKDGIGQQEYETMGRLRAIDRINHIGLYDDGKVCFFEDVYLHITNIISPQPKISGQKDVVIFDRDFKEVKFGGSTYIAYERKRNWHKFMRKILENHRNGGVSNYEKICEELGIGSANHPSKTLQHNSESTRVDELRSLLEDIFSYEKNTESYDNEFWEVRLNPNFKYIVRD
jgi:hypothetical protein